MTVALGLAVLLLAAICQVSMASQFSILGAQPNLVLVVLVAWMAVRGKGELLYLIPIAGILLGLYDDYPMGVAILALTPLILLSDVLEMRLIQSNVVQAVLIIIVATLLFETAFLLTLTVAGEQSDWVAAGVHVLVPAALANSLVLLPVYAVMTLVAVERRRPAY